MELVINYHTGIKDSVTVANLDEAKQIAADGIAYTQEKITIENESGEVLTESRWYGVAPDEDDDVLERIGEGFYQAWSDELGE